MVAPRRSRAPARQTIGFVRSADDTVQAFVAAAGGATATRRSLPERDDNPDTSASLAEWLTHERLIRQYVLRGAGHVVPQRAVALPPIAGTSAGDLDFGEAVLEFVARWPEAPRTAPGPRTADR
jgi:poly(3-hydroxybutyrate) depolymerase